MLPFQFHKGTIRTAPTGDLCIANIHFNSIKVRLELAVLVAGGRLPGSRFQFHKGTIRTSFLFLLGPAFEDFNSIKVRLELINVLYRLKVA